MQTEYTTRSAPHDTLWPMLACGCGDPVDIVARLAAHGVVVLLGLVIGLVCLCGLFLGALTLCTRLIGRRWVQDEESDDDIGHPHGIDTFRWTEE
jgi:hypothetical protein